MKSINYQLDFVKKNQDEDNMKQRQMKKQDKDNMKQRKI